MKHIVILGCGQLARMLAVAGEKLGITFTFVAFDNEPTDCVDKMGQIIHWHKGMSVDALLQATGEPEVVTVERESIDSKLLYELSIKCRLLPGPEAIATCQHRLKEKLALAKLNISTTPWFPVSDRESLFEAVNLFGYPLVIKCFENGYDGKNQWHIEDAKALTKLITRHTPRDWLVEPKIDFVTEASLIGVRSTTGEVKFYPITENHHEAGILKRSIAPLDNFSDTQLLALQADLKKLMDAWQYVGVMTMELFITHDGYMVNELAPRVHNSGHWTQSGGVASQFENHLRAILGIPLGETQSCYYSGMINILGRDNRRVKLGVSDGEINLYGKRPRAGRKLGHVNLVDSNRESLLKRMSYAEQEIYKPNFTTH